MKRFLFFAFTIILIIQSVPQVFAWQIERPYRDEDLYVYDSLKRVENVNTDGLVSVSLGVGVDDYDENDGYYFGSDCIALNVSTLANSRKYVTYECCNVNPYLWINENELSSIHIMSGVGDDWGGWEDIPNDISLRFYGGPGSAEYTRAWICSNGFVSFDTSESTRAFPSAFPSSEAPNAIIAALWTDLYIDSVASIVTGTYSQSGYSRFVVTWKNALHKASGVRLTFQIVVEEAPGYTPSTTRYHQSNIWINYKTVSAINTNYVVGIEDGCDLNQQGSGVCSGGSLVSGTTLKFFRNGDSYFLKSLTVSFYDQQQLSGIDIREENPLWLAGYHIQRDYGKPDDPCPPEMFGIAMAGTATLMLGLYGGIYAAIAAFAIDSVLVSLDWADAFASLQHGGRDVEVTDYDDDIFQQATAVAYTDEYMVDASLCLFVYWIFDDPSNLEHMLTITTTLQYVECNEYGQLIDMTPVSTSVTLDAKSDGQLDGAVLSEGEYTWLYVDCLYDTEDNYYVNIGSPQVGECIIVKMTPSFIDDNFDLYVYDPGGTQRGSGELGAGQTEEVQVQIDVSGLWRIRINPTDDNGFYSLTIGFSHRPNTPSQPTGQSVWYTGVPTDYTTITTDPDGDNVRYQYDWGDTTTTTTGWCSSGTYMWANHTWNSLGTYYIRVRAQDSAGLWSNWSPATILTITCDNPGQGGPGCPTLFVWNGTDYSCLGVIDIHNPEEYDLIRETPISRENLCTENYMAKFCLREGWMGLNYSHSKIDQVKLYAIIQGQRYFCPLIIARHNTLGNVFLPLLLSDDWKTDIYLHETIDLTFLMPYRNVQGFIFVIEGRNPLKR